MLFRIIHMKKCEVEHINYPTHPSQQQRFTFKKSKCDHAVGYLQGSFVHAVYGAHHMYIDQQAVDV